jgi:hypothetical protein
MRLVGRAAACFASAVTITTPRTTTGASARVHMISESHHLLSHFTMSSSSCAEDSAISSSRTLIKGQQAALDCSDDFAAEWQRCRASGESWGGRGRGGRGVARQYACTSSATRDVRVDNVTLAYAGLELLLPCALRISHGQRYALIGRNGCGKSSLLERIASGSLPGFPQHLRVGILHQMGEQLSCSSLRAVDACLQLGAQSRRWDLEDEREQLQTAMSEEGSAEDADITFLVQARTLLCSATCAFYHPRFSDWATSTSSWRS